METITIEPNSDKTVSITAGKVGFLWSVRSDSGLRHIVVDGLTVREGNYTPPYVVKRAFGMFSGNARTTVNYSIEMVEDKDKKPVETKEEPVKVTEEVPRTPNIINHNLTVANDWYEIRIPVDAVAWKMKARGNHTMYYSYEQNHVTFITMDPGQVVTGDTMPNKGIRAVYVMSNDNDVVVEFEVWKR